MNKVYFSPQDQVLKRIKEAIDRASSRLDLAMYVFTTAYLVKALIVAHQRGVTVRVILDRKEAKKSATAQKLLSAGISVRFLSPAPHGLFHHKFLVVDGQTVITGTDLQAGRTILFGPEVLLVDAVLASGLLLASGGQKEAMASGDLWGVWFSTQSQTCKGTGAKMRCRTKGTFAVSNKGDAPFPAFSIAFAIQEVPDTSVIKPVKSLKPGHGKKITVSFKLPPGVSAQGKKLVTSFPGNLVTSQPIP